MSSWTSSPSFRRPFKIYFSFVLEGNIRCRVPLFKPMYKICRQKNTDGYGMASSVLCYCSKLLFFYPGSNPASLNNGRAPGVNKIQFRGTVVWDVFFTIQYYAEGRINIWVYGPFILVENYTCSARRQKFWKHLYCITCLEKRSWVFLSYFPYKPTCYKKQLKYINS